VFASFMISTLFRIIGIVPGGLGTFEAASVLTLKVIGVTLPVALAATLLFRGLSFWLPMAPGIWIARHAAGLRRIVTIGLRNAGTVRERYFAMQIDEIMTRELRTITTGTTVGPARDLLGTPISVEPEDRVADVIDLMIKRKLDILPVIDLEGVVVGMVSYLDIVKHLNDGVGASS
jgi:Mg2+-importing ATPase